MKVGGKGTKGKGKRRKTTQVESAMDLLLL